MILHAYVDVYVLCVCIVGHGYTTFGNFSYPRMTFPEMGDHPASNKNVKVNPCTLIKCEITVSVMVKLVKVAKNGRIFSGEI